MVLPKIDSVVSFGYETLAMFRVYKRQKKNWLFFFWLFPFSGKHIKLVQKMVFKTCFWKIILKTTHLKKKHKRDVSEFSRIILLNREYDVKMMCVKTIYGRCSA